MDYRKKNQKPKAHLAADMQCALNNAELMNTVDFFQQLRKTAYQAMLDKGIQHQRSCTLTCEGLEVHL
jgi:hypothetical protein